jgi:putative transposase
LFTLRLSFHIRFDQKSLRAHTPSFRGISEQLMQQITVKLRLRDKHVTGLNRQARAVPFVWNFCNDAHKHTFNTRWKWRDKWLSYKAPVGLTAGSAEELDLHSHTIQRVCGAYEKSRKAKKKRWLKYRGSTSLGSVPFNTGHVSFDGKTFMFRGVCYETMHLRDILKPGIKIGAGSFNQDARGISIAGRRLSALTGRQTPA